MAGFLAIWGLSIPNFEINIYNGRHEGGRGKTQYTIRISVTLRKRDLSTISQNGGLGKI